MKAAVVVAPTWFLLIALIGAGGCRKPAETPEKTAPSSPTKAPSTATPPDSPSGLPTTPQLPPPETRNVDELPVEELVAAHRRAVGVLDDTRRGLKTVGFAYVQPGEQASLFRSLTCDATGRGKLTFLLSPPTLRGAPEGASFDGEVLWRVSYRGVVRGPRADLDVLKGDIGPDLAWIVLELGVTPLYNPLADKLGFEINRDDALIGDAASYGLTIGPPDDPYMRVILDRKTHLIQSVERMLNKRVVQRNDLREYVFNHVLEMNLPALIVSYTNPAAEEPTARWELAAKTCRRFALQKQDVYAHGTIANLADRLNQRGELFKVGQHMSIPLNPQHIHAVDIDQDGKMDAVIPAFGAIVALYNDGATPFGAWMPLLERSELHRFAASADLEATGRPDLIVASHRAGTANPEDFMYILWNKGNRRFGDPQVSMSPAEPEEIHPCDINGDELPDLAIVSAGNAKLLVFLGPVHRQPAPNFMKDLNGRGRRVTSGDFNGDGLTDLVTTNEASIDVFTQTKDDSGALAFQQTNMAVTEVPYAIVAADFDGDGRPDLAVGSGGDLDTAADPEVVVLKSSMTGTLEPMTTLVSGLGVTDLAAADFDEDGDLDLAASCFEDHCVYIWLNNGNGTFGEPESYLTDYGPRALTAADFTGDGHVDLAVINQYGNSLTLLANIFHERGEEAVSRAESPAPAQATFDPDSGQWIVATTTQPAATDD